MLNTDQMKERINNHSWMLEFDEPNKEVYLATSGWVKLSYRRALEWIEVGITDFECRTKEQMIDLINSWMVGRRKKND